MSTCGSQLGAGGDITLGRLMTAHWDMGWGGGKTCGVTNPIIFSFFLVWVWAFCRIVNTWLS